MRYREFLVEASITNPKYLPGSPVRVSTSGTSLLNKITEILPDFKADEIFEKVSVQHFPANSKINIPTNIPVWAPESPTGTFKNNLVLVIFKRQSNDQQFGIINTASSIEDSLVHVKSDLNKVHIRAKGLVAEALLGVAMYAKLIARGGDLTAQVSADDVWNIVDRIKPQGNDTLTDEVHDKNHLVSDNIHLVINLATDVQYLLVDPANRELFTNEVTNWVSYVNSSLAQLYADRLYTNNRPDNITILLAGKEGGKIDVAINVLDDKGQSTNRLEQVKLSVKLSNSLIGQVARGKDAGEIYANLEELFKPLGVDLSKIKTDIEQAALTSGQQEQFIDGIVLGYQEATAQLLDASTSKSEDATLANRVANLADKHATGNENIQVIEAGGDGNYRILNYKGLKKIFKEYDIDISVSYIPGSSSKIPNKEIPTIRIFNTNDPTSTGLLVEIRYRIRGRPNQPYANHIIEPGPLLKELAAFRRFRK